ncbi:DUF995 domain-containing protein [Aurantimonas marianensis]|uniref:DUF995 domain-containing protein n=1 Tax=Aurantimonas marianensis TaxID=2920428 RepID=A0A9X2KEQ1_9HYPH|nr:DUF995 domain-containing protein [Aurantimonas marianensis]MCP3054686.1 DUF995 domain-containing protein [Aurantimonas marianensis]
MKCLSYLSISLIAMAISGTDAGARNEGKLPKNAEPLSSDEISKIYEGHSVNYKTKKSDIFYVWLSGGKVLGIATDLKDKSSNGYAEGGWAVKENQICYNYDWFDKDRKVVFQDEKCKEWYRSGNQVWIKNTKDEDKWIGDIYKADDELKKIIQKDVVSGRFEKVKSSM